jgi:pimeloyl-ACP methyl ester carboxylesterase
MPRVPVNGIEIHYETFGNGSDPPLLLIAGLGMQLVGWSEEWFERFVSEGYYVIAYDNRDVGLSTHLSEAGVPDLMALLQGGDTNVTYHLSEMATDAAGLLDAIGISACHVVGVSMGGMIAQQLVIDHPGKVLTLCSIMSSTGAPGIGQPSDAAAMSLMRPAPQTRAEALDEAVEIWKVIGSPGYPLNPDRERGLAGLAWDRSHDPSGVVRQMGAIFASPDRTDALGSVALPTVVIHGDSDPLVNVSGGKATAAAIPGASLVIIEGMGHNAPLELWDQIIGEIVANTRAATSGGKP